MVSLIIYGTDYIIIMKRFWKNEVYLDKTKLVLLFEIKELLALGHAGKNLVSELITNKLVQNSDLHKTLSKESTGSN